MTDIIDNSGSQSTIASTGPEPVDSYRIYGALGVGLFIVVCGVTFLGGQELASSGIISEHKYSIELWIFQCVMVALGVVGTFIPIILWTEYNYLNALKNDTENK